MKYTFGSLMKADGNRSYIEIPFNVWEEYGLKGNIPAKIAVNGIEFECKLLPKRSGKYWIPVKKVIAEKLVGNCMFLLSRSQHYPELIMIAHIQKRIPSET